MKKQLVALSLAAGLLIPGAIQAQEASNTYGSIGISNLRWSDSEGTLDGINNSAIAFTVGYKAMKHLAIEAQLGTGVTDDKVTVDGSQVTLKNKEFYGVYLRPYLPVSETIELYGRLGYFSGKLSASGKSVSDTDRKNDLAYGIGAAFALSKSMSATIEYNQWFDKDDIKVSGFGIGIRSNF